MKKECISSEGRTKIQNFVEDLNNYPTFALFKGNTSTVQH